MSEIIVTIRSKNGMSMARCYIYYAMQWWIQHLILGSVDASIYAKITYQVAIAPSLGSFFSIDACINTTIWAFDQIHTEIIYIWIRAFDKILMACYVKYIYTKLQSTYKL